jgi:hypothetical protein
MGNAIVIRFVHHDPECSTAREIPAGDGFVDVTRWAFDIQQKPGKDWAEYENRFSSFDLDIYGEFGEYVDTDNFHKNQWGSEARALEALKRRIASLDDAIDLVGDER